MHNTNQLLTGCYQRAFTRHITGCQGISYWVTFKTLGLMSRQWRRERYVTINMWKIYKGLVPNDFGIEFFDHVRLGTRCRIPPLKKSSSTLKDASFTVLGPRLWNTVSKHIISALSLE